MPDQNEDDLIAQGLLLVREGIIAGNWQQVCDGYNLISGEDLKPSEPPKSRLERIREKMNTTKEDKPKGKGGRKKKEPEPEEPPKETVVDEDGEFEVNVKKFQGGKRFAREGFEVIESEVDPEEQAKNLKAASKKRALPPRRRSEKPKDIADADDTNTDNPRYHDKPKLRPPWR